MLDKQTAYIKSRMNKNKWTKEIWNEAKSESALLGITMSDFIAYAVKDKIELCRKQREKKEKTSMNKA
jgi:hypothetical protein